MNWTTQIHLSVSNSINAINPLLNSLDKCDAGTYNLMLKRLRSKMPLKNSVVNVCIFDFLQSLFMLHLHSMNSDWNIFAYICRMCTLNGMNTQIQLFPFPSFRLSNVSHCELKHWSVHRRKAESCTLARAF